MNSWDSLAIRGVFMVHTQLEFWAVSIQPLSHGTDHEPVSQYSMRRSHPHLLSTRSLGMRIFQRHAVLSHRNYGMSAKCRLLEPLAPVCLPNRSRKDASPARRISQGTRVR